jgi:hypothetical protein
MRTTILLNDELGESFRREAARRGESLSAFLAEAGRAALRSETSKSDPPFHLFVEKGTGVQPGIDLDRTNEILADEDVLK